MSDAINWPKIEAEYRAGVRSNVSIAKEHGISEAVIRKYAKNEGWVKDLSAQIKAKTEAIVRDKAVRASVRASEAISDKDIIEVTATMQAGVIVGQHSGLQDDDRMFNKLRGELEATGDNVENLKRLGELLIDTTDDADTAQAKRIDTLNKALSLPSRVDTFKKLVESQKTLIAMQREVFGINEKKSLGKSLEDFLEDLHEQSS